MTYRICKIFEVESGHMLSKHKGSCKFPHGHSRKIEVVLESDKLDENDMIIDFKRVKEVIKPLVEIYDHSICLNSNDSIYDILKNRYGDRVITFENQDPTSEVMAKKVFDVIKANFSSNGVKIRSVRIWETSSAWAEYSE